MTDDLLTQFRAGVPLADDATAQRIYAGATSVRRRERRALTLAVAVTAICVGFGVAALVGAFPRGTAPTPGNSGANGDHFFNMVPTLAYTHTDGTLTSIKFTVNDDHFAAATLNVRVVHTDVPLDQLPGTNPTTQVVYSEQVPMTGTGSTAPDAPWWTVSGTLTPSDWSGGCGDGSYGVQFAVTQTGSSSADPFTSGLRDQTGIFWFGCRSG